MIRIRKALLLNPEGEQLSRLQELHKKTMILMMQDLLKKYDVFIFNGWQTIFPNYEDLPLLRQHGKKIIHFLPSAQKVALNGCRGHLSIQKWIWF